MDETIQNMAILYADVSGSTHIYEQHGDIVARENIEICISILTEVAARYEGRVVKTIGDEAMCAFSNPIKAAIAAKEMHEALRLASEQGRFSIGELHVKIGWHYGVVMYRGAEIIGEAPVAAQQIIGLAKADEILTSKQSIDAITDELKEDARLIDTIEAEAWSGQLEVYGIPWEDEEDVTRFSPTISPVDNVVHKILLLDYMGKQIQLDSEHMHCHIGCAPGNDLCVRGKFTSKNHAEIIYKHDVFHLVDNSTNGTAVYFANGQSLRIHREEIMLNEHGAICFGGTPQNDPDSKVLFHCEIEE